MAKALEFNFDGKYLSPASKNLSQVVKTPPAGVYRVFRTMMGFAAEYLSEKFVVPSPLFGKAEMPVDTITKSYEAQESKQMGVILYGAKGAGKTVCAQTLANKLIEDKGLPVFIVDEPYSGSGFSEFIDRMGECVVFFDEFAKVYEAEQQKELLPFFDGVDSTAKRLSIVVENTVTTINEFMLDRPGRFLFRIAYNKVSPAVIKELCEYKGVPEKRMKEIVEYSNSVKNFSTDMLNALATYSLVHPEMPFAEYFKFINLPKSTSLDAWDMRMLDAKVTRIVDLIEGKDLTSAREFIRVPKSLDYISYEYVPAEREEDYRQYLQSSLDSLDEMLAELEDKITTLSKLENPTEEQKTELKKAKANLHMRKIRHEANIEREARSAINSFREYATYDDDVHPVYREETDDYLVIDSHRGIALTFTIPKRDISPEEVKARIQEMGI